MPVTNIHLSLTSTQRDVLTHIIENTDLEMTEDNCLEQIVTVFSPWGGTGQSDIDVLKKHKLITVDYHHIYHPTDLGRAVNDHENDD